MFGKSDEHIKIVSIKNSGGIISVVVGLWLGYRLARLGPLNKLERPAPSRQMERIIEMFLEDHLHTVEALEKLSFSTSQIARKATTTVYDMEVVTHQDRYYVTLVCSKCPWWRFWNRTWRGSFLIRTHKGLFAEAIWTLMGVNEYRDNVTISSRTSADVNSQENVGVVSKKGNYIFIN